MVVGWKWVLSWFSEGGKAGWGTRICLVSWEWGPRGGERSQQVAVELGMRLGDWIWRRKRVLASLLLWLAGSQGGFAGLGGWADGMSVEECWRRSAWFTGGGDREDVEAEVGVLRRPGAETGVGFGGEEGEGSSLSQPASLTEMASRFPGKASRSWGLRQRNG